MSKTQAVITAAHQINNALLPAEASSKAAALAAADLIATLLRQHEASGVDDAVGLSAIGHASRAVALTVEAREAHIRAHGALNVDLRKVGLESMYGKISPLPPSEVALPFFTGASLGAERQAS